MTAITTNGLPASTIAAASLAAAASTASKAKRVAPTGVPAGCPKRLDRLAELGVIAYVIRLPWGYAVRMCDAEREGAVERTVELDTVAECKTFLDGAIALRESQTI
jgi:hypothetical protein